MLFQRRRLKCEKLTDDDGHKVMTIVVAGQIGPRSNHCIIMFFYLI